MTNQIQRNRNNNYDRDERAENFVRHAKEVREERSSFAKVLIGMIIVFIGVLLGMFVLGNENFIEDHFGEDSIITKIFQKLTVSNANKEHADFALPFGLRRQNILFLGVDASGNPNDLWTGTRTDTIILVNIDPRTKSINALSIPRDSKVYLPGDNGVNKINAAHAIGGIEMTKKTIEDTLGVHIDRYIMVHDSAVKEIVDAMGGIDIYIEKKYVKTDMSFYEMSQYAALAKHIDMDKIEVAMLPGAPNQKGYISYWILDPEKTQEVVNRVIYRDKVAIDETAQMSAGVMASSSARAEQMAEALKAANIDVKCTGITTRAHSQFVAHSANVTNDYYNWLKKKNEAFGGLQFVYDPVNYQCGETDFTIILSGN